MDRMAWHGMAWKIERKKHVGSLRLCIGIFMLVLEGRMHGWIIGEMEGWRDGLAWLDLDWYGVMLLVYVLICF